MKLKVVILEVRTGDEKLRDAEGYRKDTMPIINSLKERNVDASVVFYSNEKAEELFSALKDVNAIIGRVNPGNIPGGEGNYFAFLQRLVDAGVKVFAEPKVMLSFGAKDAVSKLAGTAIVPANTYAYYNLDELKAKFPMSLATGPRVLKQNRGSQGSGIWYVEVGAPHGSAPIDFNTPVNCTEMSDNHVEHHKLGDFLDKCNEYLVGENGQLVDMPFMPRIGEGEIRIYLVGEKPVFILHKKPADGEKSATLQSGAKYTPQTPAEWPDLMKAFYAVLPVVKEKLGVSVTPLIWTADFILGPQTTDGKDTYVLGEFNCSCVGFTTELERGIQDMVADEVLARVGVPVAA